MRKPLRIAGAASALALGLVVLGGPSAHAEETAPDSTTSVEQSSTGTDGARTKEDRSSTVKADGAQFRTKED